MKTVRFKQVIDRSGRPHAHALWVAPERDAELSQARKAGRVLTVPASGHGKADFGVVGFEPGPGAQFLLFPKTLAPFAGARVVGIKFDLIEQPDFKPAEAGPWKQRSARRIRSTRAHEPAGATAAASVATRQPRNAVKPADAPAPPTTAAGNAARRPREDEGGPVVAEAPRARPPAGRKSAGAARAVATKGNDRTLLAALRAALQDLKDGKTVAAYQRLERAAAVARE